MGTTTPNISIYIPAAGETNYDVAFAAGMTNVDQHDHSGAPTKGVPISTSGIAANSITYQLLNNNVISPGGGLEFVVPTTQNQIRVAGVLQGIFGLSSNGFIARTGATTAAARTLTGTAGQISITNAAGTAGDPVFSLDPTNFTLPVLTTPLVITIPGDDTLTYIGDFTKNQNAQTFINLTNTTDGTAASVGYLINGVSPRTSTWSLIAPSISGGVYAGFTVHNSVGDAVAFQSSLSGVGKPYYFNGQSNNHPYLYLDSNNLLPGADNASKLGDGTHRWTEVFAANGTINTSDSRDKTEIQDLPFGLDMIEQFTPSMFKMKGRNAWNWGLIAQDVKGVLNAFETDAAVYYDPKENNSSGSLGLRYDQFIALLMKGLQELYLEVKSLKDQVNFLTGE